MEGRSVLSTTPSSQLADKPQVTIRSPWTRHNECTNVPTPRLEDCARHWTVPTARASTYGGPCEHLPGAQKRAQFFTGSSLYRGGRKTDQNFKSERLHCELTYYRMVRFSQPRSIGALLSSPSHHRVGLSLVCVIIQPGLDQRSRHYQTVAQLDRPMVQPLSSWAYTSC